VAVPDATTAILMTRKMRIPMKALIRHSFSLFEAGQPLLLRASGHVQALLRKVIAAL
jgi:hypothetical protein